MPNDRVDVVLTAPSPSGLSSSRTILENVRVLAIDANLGATAEEAATASPAESRFDAGALATLELDQAQAELIINASNGQLSLVLRPTADTTTPRDAERQAVNQSIRLTSPFWLETQQSASSGTAPAYPGM
jgi:Flp pilus assembly protein CpaB